MQQGVCHSFVGPRDQAELLSFLNSDATVQLGAQKPEQKSFT